MAIVEALSDQMAPISAEERLAFISDTSVGVGAVKRGTAASHQRELKRLAGDEKRPATVHDLSLIGITVVHG